MHLLVPHLAGAAKGVVFVTLAHGYEIILQALRLRNWNRASTADALDINRTTLYKKMKRLGLDDPRLQFA